jgi:hypothetical protein
LQAIEVHNDWARQFPYKVRILQKFPVNFPVSLGASGILGVIYVLAGLPLLSSPIGAALALPLVFGVLLLIQGARTCSRCRPQAYRLSGGGAAQLRRPGSVRVVA